MAFTYKSGEKLKDWMSIPKLSAHSTPHHTLTKNPHEPLAGDGSFGKSVKFMHPSGKEPVESVY